MTDQLTDFLDTALSERADRAFRMNSTQFWKHIEKILMGDGGQHTKASSLSVRASVAKSKRRA